MRSTDASAGTAARVVRPEHLDSLPPEDPRARRARGDLRRVHRAMRSLSILTHAIAGSDLRVPPRRILELGAGDGTLMLRLLRTLRTRWRGGDVIFLDRQALLSEATRAHLAALGWNARVLCADAIEWARSAPREHYDLCLTSLFLHHFEQPALTQLLEGVAVCTDAFVACEPRRNAFGRLGSHLLVLLGANEVTRHDALTSVEAGFAARELSALWPAKSGWRLEERFAPPFTHCFIARRLNVEPPTTVGP